MTDNQNPKEGEKPHDEQIVLKVACQDGSVEHYYIRKHMPLRKLITFYCERHGLSARQVRFSFDGERIKPEDTAAVLHMQDGHEIEVFQQQTGGGS